MSYIKNVSMYYILSILKHILHILMFVLLHFFVKFITFRVIRSRHEMYIGHPRLCVCLFLCLSLAAFPHYSMLVWQNVQTKVNTAHCYFIFCTNDSRYKQRYFDDTGRHWRFAFHQSQHRRRTSPPPAGPAHYTERSDTDFKGNVQNVPLPCF